MIVVCMLAFIAGMAGLVLQNYTLNRNLRTAARDIASDFAIYKERAVSENIQYQIVFDTTAPGSYTVQTVVAGVTTSLFTKKPSSFGSGIRIISATFGALGAQTVIFSPRGTVGPLGNGVLDGVVLQNSRNSQATITVNQTGRTYVTFNII